MILVAGFPRGGTTWCRGLLLNLHIGNYDPNIVLEDFQP